MLRVSWQNRKAFHHFVYSLNNSADCWVNPTFSTPLPFPHWRLLWCLLVGRAVKRPWQCLLAAQLAHYWPGLTADNLQAFSYIGSARHFLPPDPPHPPTLHCHYFALHNTLHFSKQLATHCAVPFIQPFLTSDSWFAIETVSHCLLFRVMSYQFVSCQQERNA